MDTGKIETTSYTLNFSMFDRMNNWFKLKEYSCYLIRAKGIHAIHSPFVYDLIRNVMNDHRTFYCYQEIEALRSAMLRSNEVIELTDLGAGSQISASHKKVSAIAKISATSKSFSQLLFRMGEYFGTKKILECGTSLGLTTLYLSSISKEAQVITLEGDLQIASLAKKNFESLGRKNITLLTGSFQEKLTDALQLLREVDLAYLDGDHRENSTRNYFNTILPCTHNDSIIVIGDIHWSPEMKKIWNEIVSQPQCTLTLDLFYVGVVFFRRELSKQHFVLRL